MSSTATEGDVAVHEKDKAFCNFKRKFCRDVAKVFSHGIEQMLLLNMAADWHKIKELRVYHKTFFEDKDK